MTQSEGSAWDSRQYFPAHINYRIAAVLDSPVYNTDFREIVENLTDLHDLVRAWYDEKVDQMVEDNLRTIDVLLFNEKIPPYKKQQQKIKARHLIRMTLHIIMKEIKLKGLLLPERTVYDEVAAFARQ